MFEIEQEGCGAGGGPVGGWAETGARAAKARGRCRQVLEVCPGVSAPGGGRSRSRGTSRAAPRAAGRAGGWVLASGDACVRTGDRAAGRTAAAPALSWAGSAWAGGRAERASVRRRGGMGAAVPSPNRGSARLHAGLGVLLELALEGEGEALQGLDVHHLHLRRRAVRGGKRGVRRGWRRVSRGGAAASDGRCFLAAAACVPMESTGSIGLLPPPIHLRSLPAGCELAMAAPGRGEVSGDA